MDQIQKQLGKGFLNATDIAEHFAKQGIPFREAHSIVGHMVKACEKKGCDFDDLTDEELQAIDQARDQRTSGRYQHQELCRCPRILWRNRAL